MIFSPSLKKNMEIQYGNFQYCKLWFRLKFQLLSTGPNKKHRDLPQKKSVFIGHTCIDNNVGIIIYSSAY